MTRNDIPQYCKMKSDTFPKENNKGIIFVRFLFDRIKNLNQRISILRDLNLFILIFIRVVQTDTSVPGNLEIRMKTKILPYHQNHLEFITRFSLH